MSSSKSLSTSDLFFTSPCSNIWLLLLLPMLPDQTCQISLIFSLGLTLSWWYFFLTRLHYSAEASLLPMSLSSGCVGLLSKYAWHRDLLAGIVISAELQLPAGLSLSGSPLRVPPGVPLTFYHVLSHTYSTGCSVPPHCPSLRRWFLRAETAPPRVGPHQDGCVQTHHIASYFLLIWQSRQRLEETEAGCCHVCRGGSRVMERWT